MPPFSARCLRSPTTPGGVANPPAGAGLGIPGTLVYPYTPPIPVTRLVTMLVTILVTISDVPLPRAVGLQHSLKITTSIGAPSVLFIMGMKKPPDSSASNGGARPGRLVWARRLPWPPPPSARAGDGASGGSCHAD